MKLFENKWANLAMIAVVFTAVIVGSLILKDQYDKKQAKAA